MWLTSSIMFSTLVAMTGFQEIHELVALVLTAWLGLAVPGHVFAVLFEDRSIIINTLGAAYILMGHLLMAAFHWIL